MKANLMLLVLVSILVFSIGIARAENIPNDGSYKAYFNYEIDKQAEEKRMQAEKQILKNLKKQSKKNEEEKINETYFAEREIMIANKVKADSKINLTILRLDNESKIGAYLSNGVFFEVNYLPDQASAIALNKIGANFDNLESYVELKEEKEKGKEKLIYEIRTEREVKFLGLFNKKLGVRTSVDAKTGEIIKVENPWWIALAR